MRLLIDMNLTPRWAEYLADAGYEAVHWSVVGHATAGDREICVYARESNLVVITNDLDFPQILSYTRQSAPSIVLLRGYPLVPEERGKALVDAIKRCETELDRGAIVSLTLLGKPRARLLPL